MKYITYSTAYTLCLPTPAVQRHGYDNDIADVRGLSSPCRVELGSSYGPLCHRHMRLPPGMRSLGSQETVVDMRSTVVDDFGQEAPDDHPAPVL